MKEGNLTNVYGAVAMLSVLLLISYLLWEKRKEYSFLFLISCVAIVNCGYFLLAVSPNLPLAMISNGIAYFGAAYSVLAMFLIIADVLPIVWMRQCNIPVKGDISCGETK